jgi:hypothetical protein
MSWRTCGKRSSASLDVADTITVSGQKRLKSWTFIRRIRPRQGKETGSSVSHYILPVGAYAAAYAELQQTGFRLHWQSTQPTKERERSRRSKTKFTCIQCGQNAWAKPDAMLACCACSDGAVRMLAEQAETSAS